ncbi:hypothetical protein DUI87_12172 [Hirundo rustica rustica]|uniref:Uncharacterized protein n=1 Tax=Hirundo rustica rustica TaxID=333673 RepID=A0A3M0KIZ8_HIRRU|nr:hypothetical protein DUI87_12172 [Hirundo rustica rustica]
MGTDPTMITPQAQAEGLRAHEVMTTTRAAREAIRSASMVIAKSSPWSTIKQKPPFYEGVTLDDPFEYSAANNPHNFLIVPRVLYHQEEEMYRFLEETIQLHKREVMTGITIAMLLGLGAAGTATGVSALVTQHQGLSQLQITIDEDLLRTEKSISSLEESISSLSEVVLQNSGSHLAYMFASKYLTGMAINYVAAMSEFLVSGVNVAFIRPPV